jgi:hypothetical protein
MEQDAVRPEKLSSPVTPSEPDSSKLNWMELGMISLVWSFLMTWSLALFVIKSADTFLKIVSAKEWKVVDGNVKKTETDEETTYRKVIENLGAFTETK